MEVLFIYKEDYPWDVRVEKIVGSLLKNLHEVRLIARNVRRSPRRESIGGLEIRRLQALPRFLGWLNHLWTSPFSANPVWLLTILSAIRERKPDLIVVRDIPLILGVLPIAKFFGCRVVLDMAECYPEMYRTLVELSRYKPFLYLVKNPTIAGIQERIAVRYCDCTLVVVEESRNRLIDMGLDGSRIAIVSNTPRFASRVRSVEHSTKHEVRLIYVGFVERIRGLDFLLRGLHAFRESDLDTRVVCDIVGAGPALSELRSLNRWLAGEDSVHFHGWLSQDESDALMARADIGVIPHRVCEAWNHTIPNKLFDYMLYGLPVLSTNTNPVARILGQVECGITCQSENPGAFVTALNRLLDSDTRRTMGINGRQAIDSRYHWGYDEAVLERAMFHE